MPRPAQPPPPTPSSPSCSDARPSYNFQPPAHPEPPTCQADEAQLTAAAAADFANVSARTPGGYATAAYDSFSPPPLARSMSGYATSAYKARLLLTQLVTCLPLLTY